MKKMIMFSALALSMACFAGTSQAATSTQEDAGGNVIIAKDAGKGPDFTGAVSPSVLMEINTDAQSFIIQSMNEVAKPGNRNEYGIWSPYTGYFQRADSAETAALTEGLTTSATTNPFSDDFQAMGGAVPSS